MTAFFSATTASMRRRLGGFTTSAAVRALALGMAMGPLLAPPATADGLRIVVVDFELVDDLHDPGSAATDAARLQNASQRLRAGLQSCLGSAIADLGAGADAVAEGRRRNRFLHRCNGCAEDIGRSAQAGYVLLPWVQKVSNLILNINAEIRDADNGAVVAVRSVDIRGNTDRSWARGVDALAARLCEKDAPALSAPAPR